MIYIKKLIFALASYYCSVLLICHSMRTMVSHSNVESVGTTQIHHGRRLATARSGPADVIVID